MKYESPLSEAVYRLVSRIPKGKVSTYGIIAKRLNVPKASRAIGSILRANSHPIVVPCHRVVMSDGRMGGYGGKAGVGRKIALLRREGVRVSDGRLDLTQYLFRDF